MSQSLFATSAISFEEYGDFNFNGKDLKIITNADKVTYQNVRDFVISNYNDYELSVTHGANLDQFKGKGLTEELKRSIENHLRSGIINANLVGKNEVQVLSIIHENTLHIRIILFRSEDLTINLTITT